MQSKSYRSICLSVLGLLAFSALGWASTPKSQSLQGEGNGVLKVSAYQGGMWQVVGALAYDKTPSEGSLDLSHLSLESPQAMIRVEHTGETAAHIDAALLDGAAAARVYGADEEPTLALRKLSQRDNDLVNAGGKTLTLVFGLPSGKATIFSLIARIEPEEISKEPFQFPVENLYQPMTLDSAFYTYAWDSRTGKITIDGDLAGENLGQPFFQEYCETGSGHPSGYTYGWVSNDAQNLYVVIEFVPDNTLDGDKDYTKVHVKSLAGLRSFKISVLEQEWGKPGFVYTPRATYQHKVYEFAIPRSELGLTGFTSGAKLSLAFTAYGTAAAWPPPDSFPGPLDPSFGNGGIQTTDLGNIDFGEGVAIQKDGKIVVVGTSQDPIGGTATLALARYEPDGSLDNTFSSDGIQFFPTGEGDSYGEAVAIQADGKILAAGSLMTDTLPATGFNFLLARYDESGELDPSFGAGGWTTVDFASSNDLGFDIAIQGDGKIVMVGSGSPWDTIPTPLNGDFILARFNTDGSLDGSFGVGGKVITDLNPGSFDAAYSVAIQGNGKIVVAGASSVNILIPPPISPFNPDQFLGASDFAAVRYNKNGTLDKSFGEAGTGI